MSKTVEVPAGYSSRMSTRPLALVSAAPSLMSPPAVSLPLGSVSRNRALAGRLSRSTRDVL